LILAIDRQPQCKPDPNQDQMQEQG
jgi:hypothetical protein